MTKWLSSIKSILGGVKIGDWLVIVAGIFLVIYLFSALWSNEQAAKVQIRIGNEVQGIYAINQNREIVLAGKLGNVAINIENGKARFSKSSCHNQYCVHQGWLSHAGQAAVCLPNQVSLELLGNQKTYDTLNY